MEEHQQDVYAHDEEAERISPPAPATMAELLDQEDFELKTFRRGQVVEGSIVSMTESEVLIDIGAKSEAIARDLNRLDEEEREGLEVGSRVLAAIVRPRTRDGHIIVSLARAQMEKDWREVERIFKAKEIFESTVAGYNKGGLIVHMGRLRGFVPGSQLSNERQRGAGNGEDRWAGLVGETLQLKVIELDRKRNRLILSERAAMREWRSGQKERLLESLKEGEVRKGTVTSLCDFGAFVDLGGADGLIHISELTWGRVSHPSEVLQPGQEVEVFVLNVDTERQRIGLSLKRLQPEPWDLVEEHYRIGQLVEGVITKLMPFGAFTRIDETIEGLIHVSELTDERIAHPKEVVKEGETHTLRIIRIDAQRRRMGLSLKRVADPQYADIDWREEYATSLQDEWSEIPDEALEMETPAVEPISDDELEACLTTSEIPAEVPVAEPQPIDEPVDSEQPEASLTAEDIAEEEDAAPEPVVEPVDSEQPEASLAAEDIVEEEDAAPAQTEAEEAG